MRSCMRHCVLLAADLYGQSVWTCDDLGNKMAILATVPRPSMCDAASFLTGSGLCSCGGEKKVGVTTSFRSTLQGNRYASSPEGSIFPWTKSHRSGLMATSSPCSCLEFHAVAWLLLVSSVNRLARRDQTCCAPLPWSSFWDALPASMRFCAGRQRVECHMV